MNQERKKKDSGKVNLKYNLELERKNNSNPSINTYDFVVREYEWTNIDEQKIKTREIEETTKEN